MNYQNRTIGEEAVLELGRMAEVLGVDVTEILQGEAV